MNNLAWQEPVAIVGMAARLPGAVDVGQYWANLRDGVQSITFPSDDELLAAGVSGQALTDPNYVKATATAPYSDSFDAEFFGLSPQEARACDPQIRLFLECAHACLENAGYDPEQLSEVGVFGSAAANRYLRLVRGSGGLDRPSATSMSPADWNRADYLAPLVSYKLGLRGPSLGVLADCSSSLVAVHLAAASLLAGECELALAGGVDIDVALGHGYWWEPGDTLSQDGYCRPFDKTATGTVYGSGVGLVALKRLSDAVGAGDHIWAVIRSTAVNNDGSSRNAFTAGSVRGQAAAIAQAMSLAGVRSADVAMVEAHATGAVQADATEVAALKAAYQQFGAARPGSCALTSVKGNIGNLGHAAGVASLIKVALSLQHETIPANVGYQDPNPALELADSAFAVPSQPIPWPRQPDRPRIAAVNTCGVGGTNVHAILEEAPARTAPRSAPDRPRVVVWSARTAQAADRYRTSLLEHFGADAGQGNVNFLDSVTTLQRGRTAHPYRGAVVAADSREASTLLRDPESAGHLTTPAPGQASSVAFLFPGQGTQHVGVAQDLYDRSPAYAAAFDRCLELFEAQGVPLRRLWHDSDEAQMQLPEIAQPLIFAVEYSLAQAWQAWGIRPAAVVGHSLGEITAATVAGIFTLEDAVRVVVVRSQALQVAPPGGMIAVAASEQDVQPFLTDEVRIAVINGPLQVIVAGPAEPVRLAGLAMEDAGLSCRQVRTSHASHVPVTAPAVPVFDRGLQGVALSAPVIDFYSAAVGRLATAAEVREPGFWSSQLIKPVLFAKALDELTGRDGRQLLIEVGPGRALTAVLRQHPAVLDGRHQVLPTLAQRRTEPLAEVRSALAAIAGVWTEGHPVDWAAVEDLAALNRLPVPGYPYERTRYWADLASAETPEESGDLSPFSTLSWQDKPRQPLPDAAEGAVAVALLPPEQARAEQVTDHLTAAGLRVVAVSTGASYADNGEAFVVRAGEPEDLALVFRSLLAQGVTPGVLVHAGTLGTGPAQVGEQLAVGFGAGAELVRQAARTIDSAARPALLVITERSVDVSGSDVHQPGYAALAALVRTVPEEGAVERAKLVDLGAGVSADDLVAELRDRGPDRVVALRGDRRWVPVERPLALQPEPGEPLRPAGVYLVTGGTGGLGGVLARQLAGTGRQPVLILTGRKAEVAPELLAELTALGATVEVSACEVTDEPALAELVAGVERRHGEINGVFHLAGVIGSGMVAFSSAAKAAATLGPKVLGALALAGVFAGRPPLDLFVGFSSRSALEGVAGGADYAAANAVLDALVRCGVPAARRSLTIDWPRWRDVGLAVPDDAAVGLPPELGGPLLLELLTARTPRQVGVRHFVDGRPSATPPARRSRQAPDPVPVPAGPAQADQPATTIGRLRVLWAGLLGPIDIPHDADFFDLGGNSLSAVELMTRVRAEFGVDIGIVALFDNPTLDGLAEQIDKREP